MDSFFGEIIKLGAAGLVVWVIAAPLIKYLIDRSKMQDDRMAQMIDEHFVKDNERHQKIISGLTLVEKRLEDLPAVMLDRVAKIYPPQASNTVVNVAQPGPVKVEKTEVQPHAEVQNS